MRQFLAAAGLSETELDQWELVLVEAGNNGWQYASEDARRLPLRFEVHVTSGDVMARIHDHTPGFELRPTVALPPTDSERGRGLFLIQTLTDAVKYVRGRGENCLVLRKDRNSSRRDLHSRGPVIGLD